ncbi:MAG: FtsX-like permease family protein [Clostridiales bacterium]|nr:FtsX-like permease family protein [Clostridiales bacterium]
MFRESLSMAIANIAANKLRSFLTILGIMIGVTAVIALITTISGVSASISDSFTSMGAGSLTVSTPGSDLKSGLSSADLDDIAALDNVQGVTPSVSLSVKAARNGVTESGLSVSGVNEFYFVNKPDTVESGRAINPIDIEDMSRVCLIGRDVMDSFFYGVNPIGQTIYLNAMRFTVVGILAENTDSSIASILSGSADILMPYTTAMKINGQSLIGGITVYMSDADASDSVKADLEEHLDALFSFEDDTYTITTMDSIESTMDSMLSMMSALLAGIASIALVVGGIGIMNMMLTSVTERTVEIGLKKAIGAEPGQIQIQFLIESFLLSMIGGVTGVVLGLIVSALMCSVMGTTFAISYGAIALGVGFSAAVGIIFGWSPARKASKLSPIDALRRM